MIRPNRQVTVKISLDMIPDFNKLLRQFDGPQGTADEFAEYIMTVFLLNHSRNAGIDPAFDA